VSEIKNSDRIVLPLFLRSYILSNNCMFLKSYSFLKDYNYATRPVYPEMTGPVGCKDVV